MASQLRQEVEPAAVAAPDEDGAAASEDDGSAAVSVADKERICCCCYCVRHTCCCTITIPKVSIKPRSYLVYPRTTDTGFSSDPRFNLHIQCFFCPSSTGSRTSVTSGYNTMNCRFLLLNVHYGIFINMTGLGYRHSIFTFT